MEDVDVQVKWFTDIHGVMGSRAVVNPPEVLDTSDCVTQRSPPAILGTEEGQGEEPQQPSGLQRVQEPSTQSDEQEPSTQNGEQHSSVQSTEVPGPSGLQNTEQLGQSVTQSGEPAECSRTASEEQSTTAGSRAKKRNLTKMEKANKEMVDVLLQAQQESVKGFLELEKKRRKGGREGCSFQGLYEGCFFYVCTSTIHALLPSYAVVLLPTSATTQSCTQHTHSTTHSSG